MTVVGQDFSPLFQKADDIVKSKTGLDLVRREESDRQVVCQWGSAKNGVRVLIFSGGSEDEAAARMKESLSHLSKGPGEKISSLGDEAYLWKSAGSTYAGIRFRKANLYVEVVAPSAAMAQEIAKELADFSARK